MCQYLSGPFAGWSLRGNYAELAWRDQMDLRLAGYTCRRKAEQRQVKPDERSLQLRRA
jgi:hypothetical protein